MLKMVGTMADNNKCVVDKKKKREAQKRVHVFNKPINNPRRFETSFYLISLMGNINMHDYFKGVKLFSCKIQMHSL
jgi:hypothetical protein